MENLSDLELAMLGAALAWYIEDPDRILEGLGRHYIGGKDSHNARKHLEEHLAAAKGWLGAIENEEMGRMAVLFQKAVDESVFTKGACADCQDGDTEVTDACLKAQKEE